MATEKKSREKKTIESRVRKIVCDVLVCDPGDVTDGTRFRDDLDADSLDVVELAMGIEEHFDIQITDDDEDPNLETFASICALVRRRMKEQKRFVVEEVAVV